MKHTIEQIKLWGVRDWLLCFAPKPISYIGNLYDWIFPRYRETLLDKVGLFFKPRQRWIKNHIEYNHWCDKVELIPKFLFGCVIHYVDEEKCFERIDWDSDPEHKKFAKELKKCYEYAKNGRDNLEKQIDEAYPESSNITSGSYEEMYGEVNRLETELRKLDKRYMTWIVVNKHFMWV
jgi:hemerythrin